jgi:hypothetical protein
VDELCGMAVSTRDLGIFSEPRVSVLELNLALEKALPKKWAAKDLVGKVVNLSWELPGLFRLARQCYPAAISSRSSPHIFSSPYITLVWGLNK